MRETSSHHAETGPVVRQEAAPRSMLVFDRDSVRSVDRAAIDEYGIPGIVLMENAARGTTHQAMDMLGGGNAVAAVRVLIVCGPGNNGGDGYAVARHLHNRGVNVTLTWTDEPRPGTDARINFDICKKMQLAHIDLPQALSDANTDHRFDLVVDGLFGTGLDRPVIGLAAKAIEWVNGSSRPVLAIDLPSGMDCNTGKPLGESVRATRTVTLVGWKAGFLNLDAQKLLGDVVVADIGAPIELLRRFGRVVEATHPESPEKVMHAENPRRK